MNIAAGGRSWLSVQGLFTLICFLMLVFTQGTVRMIFVFLTVISCLFFLVFLVFFRDPDRRPGSGVVAVADGVIQRVMQGKDDNVGRFIQLCTFMNLYDVHVNRSPFDGVITSVEHVAGGYLPAFTKDSAHNERVITLMNTSIGVIKIVQIAGTLARRIVPYVHAGDTVKKGQRIGIIRFGSRVDVYLPQQHVEGVVKTGMRVRAGESTLATIND